jgi:hypothetical protein
METVVRGGGVRIRPGPQQPHLRYRDGKAATVSSVPIAARPDTCSAPTMDRRGRRTQSSVRIGQDVRIILWQVRWCFSSGCSQLR